MQPISYKNTGLVLYTICRVLIGVVFVYASWDKIIDPAAFAKIIADYQIVSSNFGFFSAQFLPWLELVCGICLIINRWPLGSGLIITGLMIVFMAALGFNIYRGMDINCGCFTLSDEAPASMWWYMIRDIFFLATAIFVLYYQIFEKQEFSKTAIA